MNLSFDEEGRLIGAWFQGITYRRALDNRILAKWSESPRPGHRHRRFLTREGVRAVEDRALSYVERVFHHLSRGRMDTGSTPFSVVSRVQEWLQRVRRWDWARLEQERERFYRIYKPVPILPPDQYLALVLQATEGCSYNRCTFCTFYRDRPFRIKGVDVFREHVDRVKGFFGRGITTRRTIFLADANAVMVAQDRLLAFLDVANEAFPILPHHLSGSERALWREAHPWHIQGIYAFLSAPDALRKTAADFAAMRERNLRRVYVGLETGHDPLRAFIRKQGTAADVLEAVRTIKAGGVSVGIIFMVGIGGEVYREVHFRDTVSLIRQMPLGPGDILYTSPFVASPEAPYVYDAAEAGLLELTPVQLRAEEERFRRALLPWARERDVRVSHYDIREFIY